MTTDDVQYGRGHCPAPWCDWTTGPVPLPAPDAARAVVAHLEHDHEAHDPNGRRRPLTLPRSGVV